MNMPIGSYIILYCHKNRITISHLASGLHIQRESLYRSLRSADMKLSRLLSISQNLNHNFFEDYYPSAEHPGDNPPLHLTEIKQLKENIHRLETELSSYHNTITLLMSKTH